MDFWSFWALWSPFFLAKGEGGLSDLQGSSYQHPKCRAVKEPETKAPASFPEELLAAPARWAPAFRNRGMDRYR